MARSRDPWIVSTQREVARFFDVQFSRVRRWVDEGMPGRAGRYDLSRIVRWRETKDPEAKARAKRAQIKAEREESDWNREKGNLIEREDHEETIEVVIAIFREGLLNLAGSLASDVAPRRTTRDCYVRIKERFHDLLTDLADGHTNGSKAKKRKKA